MVGALAGAGACAGGEPKKNVAFGVIDAAAALGLEVAGTSARETLLFKRVGLEVQNLRRFAAAQGAVLRGVVEQLSKLLEGQGVGLHGQCLSACPPLRGCKKGSR